MFAKIEKSVSNTVKFHDKFLVYIIYVTESVQSMKTKDVEELGRTWKAMAYYVLGL